jgi:hypothetical protein
MARVELRRLDCRADAVEVEVREQEVVLGRGPLLQIDLVNVSRR